MRDRTTNEQAVVFRFSGDYNPIYIDPKVGEAVGLGSGILHGLSRFGYAARAVIQSAGRGDQASLKYFGVRFTAPVKPGEEIEARVWEICRSDSLPQGMTEVTFLTNNLTTGKVALAGGIAYVTKSNKARL